MTDDVSVKYGADTSGIEQGSARAAAAVQKTVTQINAAGGAARANATNLRAQMIDIAQGVPLLFESPTYGLLNFGNQLAQVSQITGSFGSAIKVVAGEIFSLLGRIWPLIAAVTAAFGAFQLFQFYTRGAAASLDATTKALAEQAAPLSTVQSKVKDLEQLATNYAKAIRTTADAQTAASKRIIADTEQEFNAKKQLLELELKRQEAEQTLQQAQLQDLQAELRRNVSAATVQFADDPRATPFARNPSDDARNEAIKNAIETSGLGDKIKELQANMSLGEVVINSLKTAAGTSFKAAVDEATSVIDAIADAKLDKKAAAAFDAVLDGADKSIAALQAQALALTMGHEAAIAYVESQQLIADALAREVVLGPKQIALLNEKGAAIARNTVILEQSRAVQDSLKDIAGQIAGAFGEWLSGTSSLGDALLNLTAQLAEAVVEALILDAILAAMGLAAPTSGLGAVFAPLFGGGKADGGPMDPGKWYIAGEKGPEPIWTGGNGAFAAGYGQEASSMGADPDAIADAIASRLGPMFSSNQQSTQRIGRNLQEFSRRAGAR